MKTKLLITAVLIFTIFISCNKGSDKEQYAMSKVESSDLKAFDNQGTVESENQQIPVGKFSPLADDSTASPSKPAVVSNIDWDKKIIKTATLRLEIKDFKKYNDHVHSAVKRYGGYIAGEEQNLTDEKSETVITIKVPVAQFEPMMNGLPGDDGKVLERKISTDDVTGQVVDTKSRLEAKKQMRLKYLEFLKQSKNMAEVLQVQAEINGIQEQIESAASRVNFLSQQSAFSTINLSFYQPMAGYKPTDAVPSFLTRISSAFNIGTSWLGNLLVGLIAIWPLFLIGIGVYLGWKVIRKPKLIAVKSVAAE